MQQQKLYSYLHTKLHILSTQVQQNYIKFLNMNSGKQLKSQSSHVQS